MMIMCFNALNGLLPFLLDSFAHDFHLSILKFQRPKRASSISTQFLHMVTLLLRKSFNALNGLLPFLQDDTSKKAKLVYNGFNALNGLLPFLRRHVPVDSDFLVNRFQRPKRASSISTELGESTWYWNGGFNALNGLLPFLQPPLGTRINTGFPGSFLQAFV